MGADFGCPKVPILVGRRCRFWPAQGDDCGRAEVPILVGPRCRFWMPSDLCWSPFRSLHADDSRFQPLTWRSFLHDFGSTFCTILSTPRVDFWRLVRAHFGHPFGSILGRPVGLILVDPVASSGVNKGPGGAGIDQHGQWVDRLGPTNAIKACVCACTCGCTHITYIHTCTNLRGYIRTRSKPASPAVHFRHPSIFKTKRSASAAA